MVSTKLEKYFRVLNTIDSRIFLFFLLCCNFLGGAVDANEEQYFALARHYLTPDWIPGSFSLSDVAGTRLLFQWLVGLVLQYLSFEQLAFWGRGVNYLLYAIVLARLFKKWQISNCEAFFWLQAIYFQHQAIFAREWIFKAFEAKTIAYFFLFESLGCLLDQKYVRYILLAALATCFHILVGGWFFLVTFSYLLVFSHTSYRRIVFLGALYVGSISPFLAYLTRNYDLPQASSWINGINVDYIYVYVRNPHHLAIFKSWTYFLHAHASGVLVTIGLYGLCLGYFSKIHDKDIAALNQLNIVIFTQQILFLLVALFDRNGVLLKSYPYRTSALSAFLMTIQVALYIKRYRPRNFLLKPFERWGMTRARWLRDLVLTVISVLFLSLALFENLQKNRAYFANNVENLKKQELYAFVTQHTPSKDIFFFYTAQDHDLAFMRKTGRDVFVIEKFVPTSKARIYEWYQRLLAKENALRDVKALRTLTQTYRVDYVISLSPLASGTLRLVFHNAQYFVYTV